MFERRYEIATGPWAVDTAAGIELRPTGARDFYVTFKVIVGDRPHTLSAEYTYDKSTDPPTVAWNTFGISRQLADAITSRGLDARQVVEEAVRVFASVTGPRPLVVTSVTVPSLIGWHYP